MFMVSGTSLRGRKLQNFPGGACPSLGMLLHARISPSLRKNSVLIPAMYF